MNLLGKEVMVQAIRDDGEYWTCRGVVVFVFPAKQQPVFEDVCKYFEVSPNSRVFSRICRPIKFDRVAIKKTNGRYAVIPLTPSLKAQIKLI